MIQQKSNEKKNQNELKILQRKKNYKKITKKFYKVLFKKPFLKLFWRKYISNLETFSEKAEFLPKYVLKKKKEVLILNQIFEKSKLSPFFFTPWKKENKVFLTEQQRYLIELYDEYRSSLYLKERKNFLKTYFGEILKTAYLHSPEQKGIWISARILNRYKTKRYRIKKANWTKKFFSKKFRKDWAFYHKPQLQNGFEKKKKFSLKKVPWLRAKRHAKQYKILRSSMQKGWLYENLLKKKTSRNAIYFELEHPYKTFQSYFKQQAKEPWIDPLIYKRWAYFGFIERNRKENKNTQLKLKDYLRKRNPRFQKRNKLFWWRRTLLFKKQSSSWEIRKKKALRVKEVLKKIYLPFYGNLNNKQLQAILKKKKKSCLLNKNEKLLSFLENRLDVVVYRLNLAPNILWARRLIQEGSIFVNNIFSSQNWILMYSQIKHFIFPLKLRDPKNLYKTKFWNPNKKISKFKFLLAPIKKNNYIVKPGDFIQSARNLTINRIKNNIQLFQKPIKKNLYTVKKLKKHVWSHTAKAPQGYSTFPWREPGKQISAALFLFDGKFTDLKKNDRAREQFFSWITL